MNRSLTVVMLTGLVLLVTAGAIAQFRNFRHRRNAVVGADGRPDRRGVPDWKVDEKFKDDIFTFVRIRYNSYGGRWGKWATDYPDAELNFSSP